MTREVDPGFTVRAPTHFRINGGVEYSVTPSPFGSATSQSFPKHSNLPLPSFKESGLGPWMLVELICDSFDALSERFPDLSPAAQGETPVCVVWWQFERWTEDFDAPREFFFMPIADLTDRRFRAVSESGWVLEGFRLSYD